jgi:hypothetical protein
MLPEIVTICVTDCSWADIVQDSSTKVSLWGYTPV